MTLHRRAAKRDEGEAAIVSALRSVGALVWHVSARGLPDLLVGFRRRWTLLEVKSPPGKRGGKSEDGQKLAPAQVAFFDAVSIAELPARVVTTAAEALAAIGVEVR